MNVGELDDIILDIRDKIGYLIPIVIVSILCISGFGSIQVFSEITSENIQRSNIVISSLMILFSLLLLIPLKLLLRIFNKTKELGQKIFVNNIFDGLLKINILNENMGEKLFEIITKGMPQFSNAKYTGKKKINQYEFDIFQTSPTESFPQRLWQTKEIVYVKYLSKSQISQKDLTELYAAVSKSKPDQKNSIKIFCIGEDFEPIFYENEKVQQIVQKVGFSHYLILLKYNENGFEVIWIGNKNAIDFHE